MSWFDPNRRLTLEELVLHRLAAEQALEVAGRFSKPWNLDVPTTSLSSWMAA
jgi:hypothetical protein